MTNVTTVDATHLWRCETCQDDHARWVCPACQRPNMDWAYWTGDAAKCQGCNEEFIVLVGDSTIDGAPRLDRQERETQ